MAKKFDVQLIYYIVDNYEDFASTGIRIPDLRLTCRHTNPYNTTPTE